MVSAQPEGLHMMAAAYNDRQERDPHSRDFPRVLAATGELAEALRLARTGLLRPIHFLRGSEDDFE